MAINQDTSFSVVLVHSHKLGGSGIFGTQLTKALSKRGHTAVSVTFGEPHGANADNSTMLYEVAPELAYPLFPQPIWTLPLAEKIVDVCLKYDSQIINWHYGIVFGQAALLAQSILLTQGKHVKVVGQPHGSDVTKLGKQIPQLFSYTLKKADMLVGNSQAFIADIQQLYGINGLIHIPNMVDTDRFKPQVLSELRNSIAEPHERIVVHVSNFREVKRPYDVIKIFSKIKEQIQAKLLLVGAGPMLDTSIQQALAAEIDIVSVGAVEDVAPYLAVSDVMLHPSEYESWGLVLGEAQACGVPVLAYRVGGIPEVVVDGKTGFLSALGDTEKLANHAVTLLENSALLGEMKRAAIQHAQQFSIEYVTDKYEGVFKSVLGKSKGGGESE